jgi:ankyrin repeat protein
MAIKVKINKELEKSVLLGDLSLVKSLVKNVNSDAINATDKYGRTVLYDAIVKGFEDIVIELCLSGINVNNQDKNGKTPLHFAAIHNQPKISKILIQNGADVNLRDENGNTPIFDAIFNSGGNPEIIVLLKENNADYVTANLHGVSPKELANTIGNFDVSYIFN